MEVKQNSHISDMLILVGKPGKTVCFKLKSATMPRKFSLKYVVDGGL